MDRKATDAMTRDEELDRLVGDSRFLRYHEKYVKPREFNAFDVLRYAEYEIRPPPRCSECRSQQCDCLAAGSRRDPRN